MSLVVDASVTLSRYFEDERTVLSDAVLTRVVGEGAVVPSLWRLEVASGLQIAIRRKRIDGLFRDGALQRLSALPIVIYNETSTYAWTTTLRRAEQHGLTIYDAASLELAQRRRLSLATLDRHLRDPAGSSGVSTQGSMLEPTRTDSDCPFSRAGRSRRVITAPNCIGRNRHST